MCIQWIPEAHQQALAPDIKFSMELPFMCSHKKEGGGGREILEENNYIY